ncbi:Transcription activator BRG1 [Balamuthia mandrillaris]
MECNGVVHSSPFLQRCIEPTSDRRADEEQPQRTKTTTNTPTAETEERNALSSASSSILRILLVEDNKVNQMVTKRMLHQLYGMGSHPLEVDVAVNGEEAVKILTTATHPHRHLTSIPPNTHHHRPHCSCYSLVLMDIQMPVMDGVEATELIRRANVARPDGQYLPIIALTTHVFPEEKRQFLAAGMDDLIAKPMRKSQVESVLRLWLPDLYITDRNEFDGGESKEKQQQQDEEQDKGKEKKKKRRRRRGAARSTGWEMEADGESREDKLQRLQFLLDKTTLYSQFLSQKLTLLQEPSGGAVSQSRPTKKRKRSGNDAEEEEEKESEGEEQNDKENGTQSNTNGSSSATEMRVGFEQPALVSGGKLREYRLEGVNWLARLYENGVNGILADEMGLGKTIQTIGFLAHLYENDVKGPFLVVGPLSTLSNWVAEVKRWAPEMPVLLYHGMKDERVELRNTHFRSIFGPKGKKGVVVTSYEVIMKDARFLRSKSWKYLVVDEGHRLKNMECKLIKELKTYNSSNRLLLTGTPLQNNLSELWSLLSFLMPDIFDDLENFQRWFDFDSAISTEEGKQKILAEEQENQIVTKLHRILSPFLLRRVKADVELALPAKEERVISVSLTQAQMRYYSAILNHSLREELSSPTSSVSSPPSDSSSPSPDSTSLDSPPSPADSSVSDASSLDSSSAPTITTRVQSTKLQNMIMQLRKACNHPYLFEWPIDTATGDVIVDEQMVSSSGKLLMLDRLLPRLKAEGHKILLFSQMTMMLDILQEYFELRQWSFHRIDGSTPQPERERQIKEFNQDPSSFCFLLSTRAGGLGINLTAANVVIFYDNDWNPQMDLQAQDRCHRIGQTKAVRVYRFVTANTVESRMMERANNKLKLGHLVLTTEQQRRKKQKKGGNGSHGLSMEELSALLNSEFGVQIGVAEEVTDAQLFEGWASSSSPSPPPSSSPSSSSS